MCDFLGVSDESPVIDLKRTNPFKIEEMVVNFEEIKVALNGTNYEWMMDDE